MGEMGLGTGLVIPLPWRLSEDATMVSGLTVAALVGTRSPTISAYRGCATQAQTSETCVPERIFAGQLTAVSNTRAEAAVGPSRDGPGTAAEDVDMTVGEGQNARVLGLLSFCFRFIFTFSACSLQILRCSDLTLI